MPGPILHPLRRSTLIFGLLSLGLLANCSETSFQSARVTSDQSQGLNSGDADANKSGQNPNEASSQDAMGKSGSPSADVETTEIGRSQKPDTVISSFSVATTQEASYRFSLAPKSVKTDFTLVDIESAKKDSFTQQTRNFLSDSFTQGNAAKAVQDSFTQNAKKGLVDILVVIDNSGSMKEEQVNLSQKLNELLVSIKDANWQIAVTTTAPSLPAGVAMNDASSEGKELCNTVLIKAGDVDAMDKFSKAVMAGTSGTGNEQGIRQSVVGLRCSEKPWLRPNATLAVLIVSDEDNCSIDGKDCGTLPWAKESYLISYTENSLKKVIGKDAGFYGLVGPNKTLCPTAGNAATQYLRLFSYKANGTQYGNICDADYKPTLNKISDSISLLLNNQFELSSLPETGTLKLSEQSLGATPQLVDPLRYNLSGRVITFAAGKEPSAGSKVLADYRTGAKPILKSFTLTQDPAAETLAVKVNGQLLNSTQYTVSGRVVSLVQTPADFASVVIDYRQNSPLTSSFRLSLPAVPGSVKLAVAGQASADFSYDASKQSLVFSKLPADGLAIDIQYLYREGPQLEYSLPLMKDARQVQILDGTQAVAYTEVAGVFKIAASAHQKGKTLSLSYEIPDGSTRTFDIGYLPIPGSVQVTGSDLCSLGNGLFLNERTLSAQCVIAQATDFVLSFKHIAVERSFTVKGIADAERGSWSVFVDGEPTKEFERVGSTIKLLFDPALDAKVEIHYTLPE